VRRRALLSGSVATLATLPAVARAQWVDCGGLVPAMVTNPGPCDPPSLDLTFTVPGSLDPRITFTRASTATYFDSAGVMQTAAVNAPRWDYDPVTRALRGLLIEEARTNLLLNSAALSTQSVTVTAVAHTLSFYGTGTVTKSGTATGALVGTGAAQRVSQTFTPTAGTLTLTVTGTVSNAQLEVGAFVTSYTPSSGTAATRAADVMSMPTSAWYNAAAGSLAVEVVYGGSNAAAFPVLTSIDDATSANAATLLVKASGFIHAEGAVSSVSQWAIVGPTGPTPYGTVKKVGLSMAPNNINYCINGVLATADLAATLPAVTTLHLGCSAAGVTGAHSVAFRSVRYWSRALSAAELQTVTTP
jgi:hypothetical protein